MGKETLYNFNVENPVAVSREEYVDVGSGVNILGNVKRAFRGGSAFQIWDAASGGNQLVEDEDYELLSKDDFYSSFANYVVYGGFRILNPAYQTGSIYITYQIVGTYIDADFFNTFTEKMDAGVFELTDGATIAIDWNNGATQYITLADVGRTVTFANPVEGTVYRLIIIQGSGGSKTITSWPTIKWAGGSVPVFSTAEGKADIVTLLYANATYYADINKNF
jgi:hypothetical protein